MYNRGNDKRLIFRSVEDYKRFMILLYLSNGTRPVSIKDEIKGGKEYKDFFENERGERYVNIGAYALRPKQN